MGKIFNCCRIQLKFRLRVRLKRWNERGEFELDRARRKNNIVENSVALGYETHNSFDVDDGHATVEFLMALNMSVVWWPNLFFCFFQVKRKIDTQLLLLQSQLESCDKEILEGVKDDLRRHTLDWSSQRQANGVQKGKTDKYAGKLFEVLAKGKTTHPNEFSKP